EANKGDLALAAYELGLLSGQAAREALGYNEADAPDQDELARRQAAEQAGQPQRGREALVPSAIDRLADRLRDTTNRRGPASERETKIGIQSLASDAGWAACADIASRRALRRCGPYLLGPSRGLRGKYKTKPHEGDHTQAR